MTFYKTCLNYILFAIFASNLVGQEIVSIGEAKPRMIIQVQGPNGNVFTADVESITDIGSTFSPKNFQHLDNPSILENVELSEVQKEQLNEIRTLTKQRAKELSENLKNELALETSQVGRLKVANKYMKEWNNFSNEISEKLENELVPHQSKIIDRSNFQKSILHYGLGRTMLSSPWKKELKIEKKQHDEIDRLNDEMDAEVRKQVAKIRADTERRIKKLLNKEQINAIETLRKPFK